MTTRNQPTLVPVFRTASMHDPREELELSAHGSHEWLATTPEFAARGNSQPQAPGAPKKDFPARTISQESLEKVRRCLTFDD